MRVRHVVAVAALLASCASASGPSSSQEVSSVPVAVTAQAVQAEEIGHVFLLHDSGGLPERPGPFLADVTRPDVVAIEDRLAALTTVTAAEAAAGYTTAVPTDTVVRSVAVEGGVATIDLSAAFAVGDDPSSMRARLAQLVYTATAGPEWARKVVLQLDGRPVTDLPAGITLTQPLTRDGSDELLPVILVELPASGESVSHMLSISGVADVSDRAFRAELLDADGAVVQALPDITTARSGRSDFYVTVSVPGVDPGTELVLHVWDDAPGDPTPVGERFVPVTMAST